MGRRRNEYRARVKKKAACSFSTYNEVWADIGEEYVKTYLGRESNRIVHDLGWWILGAIDLCELRGESYFESGVGVRVFKTSEGLGWRVELKDNLAKQVGLLDVRPENR